MAARPLLPRLGSCSLGRLARLVLAVTFTFAPLVPVSPARAYDLDESGKWTPRANWDNLAVHLALLRGNGPFHSKILYYFGHHHETLFGGLWGWRPRQDSCSTYPDTSALLRLPFDPPEEEATLFCSGMTTLADGRLFVAGGTQAGTEFGIRKAFTYDANLDSADAWVELDSMETPRWYPTNTLMADGKVLVTSGSHHQHIHFFGGRTDSALAPADSAILRYGIGEGGTAETAVRTSSSARWPEPREGHSAVFLTGSTEGPMRVFGGKDSTGEFLNDVWDMRRLPNASQADYDYAWQKLIVGGTPPSARWRHSSVNTNEFFGKMIVFGGIARVEGQDLASNGVWRLWWDTTATSVGYKWAQVTVINPNAPTGPGARTGHSAVWHAASRSLLMFGGRGTPSGAPVDSAVWQLQFGSDMTSGIWTKLTDAGPSPRAEFATAFDKPYWDGGAHHMFVFGGAVPGGKANDLWRLRVDNDTLAVSWQKINFEEGTPPSPRSQHSLTPALGLGALYAFGGSSTDDTVYVAQCHPDTLNVEHWMWHTYARNGAPLTGHTATFQDGAMFQRKPELYTPGDNGGSWTTFNNAPRLQEWYPHIFTWKPDTVFAAGPDNYSFKLALSAPSWTAFPSAPTPSFRGGTAVMYRPGKVLRAGGVAGGDTITGKSYWSDLSAGSSAYWHASQNEMLPRLNHNLVILPNGKVLVVGGTSTIHNKNAPAQKRPEIWDPDGASGQGQWQGLDILDTQPTKRDYHSTAILLPDGRVLSASGDGEDSTRSSAEIFCPPYLFNGNGPATRPTLLGATERWRYGADVTFAASGDSIASACLIRPGATTHGFDEAQRYVPLILLDDTTFAGSSVRHYFLEAPPDSFVAPPGDYLLFVSNAAGVPSVARWVRVGSATARQNDQGAPDELTFGTTFIYCNEISPIYWNAPGDDGGVGTALDYDIRYSFSPITTSNFPSATPMSSVELPLLAGTLQTGSGFVGLSPASVLYVAGKTRDRVGNYSPLAIAEFWTLSSCEGGGYGLSSRRSRDSEGASEGSRATARTPLPFRAFTAPSSMLTSGSPLRLVGEYVSQDGAARWRLHVVDLTDDQALLQATSGHAVVQHGSIASGWSTQSSTALSGGTVGIRTLPAEGRIVFPAGTWMEAVDLDPRGYECTEVLHSRLGDLSTAADSTIVGEFTSGDSLSLTFSPAPGEGAGAGFFRVRVPGEARTATARRPQGNEPRTPETADLPTTFALHPARPNPFSRATQIRFDLPRASRVEIELFDVQGRRVAALIDEPREAGRHMVVWDGRAATGGRAAAGIYVCRMRGDGFEAERRISLLP